MLEQDEFLTHMLEAEYRAQALVEFIQSVVERYIRTQYPGSEDCCEEETITAPIRHLHIVRDTDPVA